MKPPLPVYVILGASFDTGNLGVGALAWSSINVIRRTCPSAEIALLGIGRQPGKVSISVAGEEVILATWPVRFCVNPLITHHIIYLYTMVFVCWLFPFLRRRWATRDSTLGVLLRCKVVCDITGGDSFSDIYGLERLIRGFLCKHLCQMTGKPFVLLPQTYGPFKSRFAQCMARFILSRAAAIYSRDREGLEQIQLLMGNRKMRTTPQLCPDVAFVLDSTRPNDEQTDQIEKFKGRNLTLIGLNISGLLYNGGYTQDNMFGLACDYRELVKKIVLNFVKHPNHYVLLVPHVIPENMPIENDIDASWKVWQSLTTIEQEKVIVIDGRYNQNEIKHIIGLCDFFVGSRMHATIAALSQYIPAVGMAYSKKFTGVFDTVGVSDSVVDLRKLNESECLRRIEELYENRHDIKQQLKNKIPGVQQMIYQISKTIF